MLGSYGLNAITGNNSLFSTEEHNLIYANLHAIANYRANFYDVTIGSNGGPGGALAGWDSCTGVGSPRGLNGK
jgi:hypothetical protein